MTVLTEVTTKVCPRCQAEKPRSDFYPKGGGRPGVQSRCKPCLAKGRDEWRRANRVRVNASQRAAYAADPERYRGYNRKYRYVELGMTPEQFEQMVVDQKGLCVLCGRRPNGRRNAGSLHLDHDHETNLPRAALCSPCNTAIGLLQDDPELMVKAADYIARYRR